jgi:hypothetical protein
MSADDTTVLPATMAPRAPAPRIPLYVASGVAVLALGAAALSTATGVVEAGGGGRGSATSVRVGDPHATITTSHSGRITR